MSSGTSERRRADAEMYIYTNRYDEKSERNRENKWKGDNVIEIQIWTRRKKEIEREQGVK